MVKLPGAEAFGERQVAGPQRPIQSVRNPGETQRAVQQGALQSAQSAQEFGQFADRELARIDKLDYATAQSRFLKEKAKADAEFAQDQDYATAKDRYEKRLNDVRGKFSSEIGNNQTRALFEQYTNTDIAQGSARISGIAVERERDAGRAHINDLLDQNRETALMASNPETAQAVLSATRQAIDGAVAKGYLSEQEAQRQNRTFAESYAIGKVELMTPAQQLGALRSGMKQGPEGASFGQSNSFVDFIPSDKRMMLIQRAESEVKRMGAMERAELGSMARDHFASLASTGQGLSDFMDRAKNAFDPQQYAELKRQDDVSRETFNFTDSVKFANPQEMQARLDRMAPAPGSMGFADQQQAYEGAARMVDLIKKKRFDDPAGYVLQIPEISASWQAANSGEGGQTLKDYSSKTLAAQDAMGIPEYNRRVLPVNVSKALIADLSAPDKAEQAADTLMTLQQQYGPYWGSAYRDLVKDGLPPDYAVLGAMDSDTDIVARKDMAAALKVGPKNLGAIIPDADKKAIGTSVESGLAAWSRAELGRGATDSNVQAMRGAGETLAMYYASRGQSADQASASAVNALVGRFDILDIPSTKNATAGFNMYVPKGEADNIEMKGRRVMARISPEMLAPIGANEFIDPAKHLESVRNGTWVLDQDGIKATLLDEVGQPVYIRDPSQPDSDFMMVQFSIDDPTEMSGVELMSRSILAEKERSRPGLINVQDLDTRNRGAR